MKIMVDADDWERLKEEIKRLGDAIAKLSKTIDKLKEIIRQ